jgi:hypothetical protein
MLVSLMFQPSRIGVLGGCCPIFAERGEAIEEVINEAVWQKFEQRGVLGRYRKEHGLSEDWPFGDKDDQEAGPRPLSPLHGLV